MSRAMGSSCVFMCWGAASWHGGRVMLVFGARAAAGAGSCAGGGAPFGVVVVCGCTLVAVLAGGVAPVCGSGCGRWWVFSWREAHRWGCRGVALFPRSFDLAYGASKYVHQSNPRQGCT